MYCLCNADCLLSLDKCQLSRDKQSWLVKNKLLNPKEGSPDRVLALGRRSYFQSTSLKLSQHPCKPIFGATSQYIVRTIKESVDILMRILSDTSPNLASLHADQCQVHVSSTFWRCSSCPRYLTDDYRYDNDQEYCAANNHADLFLWKEIYELVRFG